MKTLTIVLLLLMTGCCPVDRSNEIDAANSALTASAHAMKQAKATLQYMSSNLATEEAMNQEYLQMATELTNLHDPKVAAILYPHLKNIQGIIEERLAEIGDSHLTQ